MYDFDRKKLSYRTPQGSHFIQVSVHYYVNMGVRNRWPWERRMPPRKSEVLLADIKNAFFIVCREGDETETQLPSSITLLTELLFFQDEYAYELYCVVSTKKRSYRICFPVLSISRPCNWSWKKADIILFYHQRKILSASLHCINQQSLNSQTYTT